MKPREYALKIGRRQSTGARLNRTASTEVSGQYVATPMR